MEEVITISDDDEIPLIIISSDEDEIPNNENQVPLTNQPDERPAVSNSRPGLSVLEELMQDDHDNDSDPTDDDPTDDNDSESGELIIDEKIRTPPLERYTLYLEILFFFPGIEFMVFSKGILYTWKFLIFFQVLSL